MEERFKQTNDELDFMLYPKSFIEEAEEEAKDLLNCIKLSVGKDDLTLLDIPCGVGRHSVSFAREGVRVTGVDICKDFLEAITLRIAENNEEKISYEVVLGDMRSWCRKGYFDVAICLWDSIGLCGDDDDILILKNIYNNLKEGGLAVIEVYPLELWCSNLLSLKSGETNFEFTKKHLLQNPRFDILSERVILSDNFKRVSLVYSIKNRDDGTVKEDGFDIRVRGIDCLTEILEKIGFTNIELCVNYKKDKYTQADILDGRTLKIFCKK